MVVCGGCGAQWPAGLRFCGGCGAPLESDVPTAAQERKVVSVLFCDVVGSTAMSESADPEDVHALMRRYFAAVRAQIVAHGGVVEKFIGDAAVGVFGVPASHEDDAGRAVRAGLAILEVVGGLTRPDGDPLQVRIGINTGEALVRLDVVPSSGEGFLTGDMVNTAARIESVAPAGGVAVGLATFESARRAVEFVALPPATVKGKSEPVLVWRAVAVRPAGVGDGARPTGLIGRAAELAALTDAWDAVVQECSPRMVAVVGEPGIGKSRLVAEAVAHVTRLPYPVTWLQGHCLPYGEGITFWALGEIVKAHAGILETDPAEVALERLDAVLPDVPEREWVLQRLRPLVGVESSPADRGEAFAAWRRFVQLLAAERPTVLVFEDLHWADPELLAFLDHLVEPGQDEALLVVGTSRPDIVTDRADLGPSLRPAQTVHLAPLTELETTRLVATMLGADEVQAEVLDALVQRSEGNPLFAEEYVRLLEARGLVIRDDDEVVVRPGVELPLPVTVQALIAARLDTLLPRYKAFLADASVIGRVFWSGAVAAMSHAEVADVEAALHELSLRQFVTPVGRSSMAGQREYTFWHALTRDVAYAQLPRRSRADRHLAAAGWIRDQAGDRLEDLADVVAHHYATALELASAAGEVQLVEQVRPDTIEFLLLAGERALKLSPAAATTHVARAVALAPSDGPLRARALVGYGQAMLLDARLPEVQPALEEAIDLALGLGDVPLAVTAILSLASVLEMRADPTYAIRIQQAVDLAAQEPLAPLHARVYAQAAAGEMVQGRSDSALRYAELALDAADRLGVDAPAGAFSIRGLVRADRGDPGGLDDCRRAVTIALSTQRSADVISRYYMLGMLTSGIRPRTDTMAVFQEGHEYAVARGMSAHADAMTAELLHPLIAVGELDDALRRAEAMVDGMEARHQVMDLVVVRAAQVRALALQGRPDLAEDWLDWLDTTTRSSGNPGMLAYGSGAAAIGRAALGQREAAIDAFVELVADEESCHSTATPYQLPTWARAVVMLGRIDLAEVMLSQVVDTTPAFVQAVLSVEAAIAEARQRYAEALDRYDESARRWHEFRDLPEEAFALLGRGRCLIALERRAEAAQVLESARTLFASLGARPAIAEAEELLRFAGE